MASKRTRAAWAKVRDAEHGYARALRRIAGHVGDIVRGALQGGGPAYDVVHALQQYAHALDPWARSAARLMVLDVARRDERAWRAASADMSTALQRELRQAPIGYKVQQLMEEQVHLIKSLPLEAAQRVQKLATGALYGGERPADLLEQVLRTGDVTRSRAELIARTETGRASTSLTQARAQHVGSDGYVWRTARDGTVRKSHRKMEGKFVAWDAPPTLDSMTGHAGTLPNCRCYPEPVLAELD